MQDQKEFLTELHKREVFPKELSEREQLGILMAISAGVKTEPLRLVLANISENCDEERERKVWLSASTHLSIGRIGETESSVLIGTNAFSKEVNWILCVHSTSLSETLNHCVEYLKAVIC